MKQVRIAEFKSHLSADLRAVRAGDSIAILDRDTPVAHVIRAKRDSTLKIRKPHPGSPTLNRVPLSGPLKIDLDIVALLLEERQSHR